MTLNAKFNVVDMATVPVGLPANLNHRLAFRGLSSSRLISADVRYGPSPAGGNADFAAPTRVTSNCQWTDAYAIGVRLQDERSDVFVDGRTYSHSRRKGETHLLYLSGVEQIDFNSPRHTFETILPRSFMREIADDLEVPHVTHLGRSFYDIIDDPVLPRLAGRMLPFVDAPETLDPLFADHYMWSLGIYVCAHYGDLAPRRRVVGGLSTWQERLAKEVIETRLVGGIGLAELAVVCGLRASQFAHAFKRSTGMAPYQWLQWRRVELAKSLLSKGRTSLTDVALACGFSDQSHLTRSFARQVGATPGAWRATLH
ncbi:AraC family transcriptional regulator [Mesorhizobium soli]|uniref:helix-turn-helix domain-containing protein n=1 Tax=Pseudaminobacter soli (ex Li et al. 2025) TaxID=1295366 RepID=UPI0024756EFA|nr:AraC family transcriptional regulator [Mesorhizobium soli]MDH6230253.1 AraC family transcriptional regulator [Mesorhizobium soli]